MKILQVGSSLESWGGIERYVSYLSEGLSSRGHEVVVSCAPCSPLDMHSAVSTLPIRVRRKFDFKAFRQYLQHFRENHYDVVHVHFSPDFLLPALAARITGQSRLVMTRHVVLPWSPAKIKLYSYLFDHFIPVSNAVERQLLASGMQPNKMTVAKAGCPPLIPVKSVKESRAELGLSDDVVALGYFGRLVVEKGVETLIAACQSLPENIRFEVFGNGPLSSELEKQAASENARVRFHGFREDVTDCIQAMNAVVIPSVWEEAFPYAALEAMSVGRPVLASRVGGMSEIVEDGKTGWLFEKGDVAGLSRAALAISNDLKKTEAMGEIAMEVHRHHYTVEKMAERIESVYQLVEKSGKTR